jgi:hypothetical protein
VLAHFLRGIANYAQRVGRQIPEQIVEVAAIEHAAWDVVRCVGDNRGEIDVQRRKHFFQMLGAAVEIHGIDVGIDRVRHVPGLLARTLIKDLKAAGLPAVGVIPEGDKLTRVSIQLEKFTNGQVLFPREAPWLVDFENELLAFPNGRYDDQVDALIQALAYKRPISLFDDAALKGWENFANALWLQQMRGF